MSRDPYCGNCGYSLVGLTESSRCPECGKPIVEVLERERAVMRGRRYRSDLVLFGLPLLHIAFGPDGDEPYGKARGIIAIGDTARGWLAIGGRAVGIIAIGGLAVGVFAMGGLAIGLIAIGGAAFGGAAVGGGAFGGVVSGGGAVGLAADGGGAVGYYARGGGAYGVHTIDWRGRDPEAVAFFDRWHWLLGSGLTFPLWLIVGGALIGLFCTLVLLPEYARVRRGRVE